jgi:predicted transcriptional regulator
LESVLDGIGLELDVTVLSNGSPKVSTPVAIRKTRKSSGRKAPGVKRFWNAVRKLAAERGITPADAKVVYLREKEANPKPSRRKVSKSARAAIRRAQNKYWKSVDKIAAENNCSKAEARKILKTRKAALTV